MELLSMLFGTGLGLGASAAANAVREHRSEPADPADILNWAFLVDPGVVLMKDGSFLAGWRYRGPDTSAATNEELNLLSRRINDALLPLADGWMLHIDAMRRPAREYAAELPGGFPDSITRIIDEERRSGYESGGQYFETEYYLVVTHTPPPDLYSRIGALFVQGGERLTLDWSQVLERFQASILTLENALSGRLHPERLESDALLTHLHSCLTGMHHAVRTPRHGSYLNCLLADEPISGGFRPRVGEFQIRPVAVMGYPHESEPGILDLLNGLGFAYRWSNRVIPLGRENADREIKRIEQRWYQKRKSLGVWIREILSSNRTRNPADEERWLDQHAIQMGNDTAAARAENASGEVRFCYYTSTVVVMERDHRHADYIAAEIVKALNEAGFAARVETVNALEAYLGSLPGHGYPNIRRTLLASTNIADLLPTTSVWPGLPTNPSQYFARNSPALMWTATDGNTPFRLNLHDSDVGHTLLIGKTGAGKSILVEALAAQWMRYPAAQLFYFDHGYSAWLLAKACGWTHYEIAAGESRSLGFQPLARVDDPVERAWAAEWLETIFDLHGNKLTPVQRERIDDALRLLASMEREHRTLTDLRVQLQDPELQEVMRYYTLEGNLGYLLDSKSDCMDDAPAQVFELKHLLAMGDKVLVPTLLYLFRRVEQRLESGRPTLIPVEELWAPLMRSIFANRIDQWLLTLRKQNAAVLLVAHSVGQLHQLPNRHVLIESCPTKIFLPNPDAKTEEARRLYAELGLNDREVDILAESTPKQHYYFKSPRGSRRFELALGSAALSFLAAVPGTTMEETRRNVTALAGRQGPAWPGVWLRERGLDTWADRFNQLTGGQDASRSYAA
jgi:type IV secretion/conjugal transfer VirB4 family ATPase